jgi:CDP-diacylglycerol---glycerol-3-phosphate 3-phosphatidyltransferase
MTERPPGLASAANLLGVLRIAATPVVMALLLLPAPGTGLAAFVIFAIAAATDFFDGRIARARDEVSPLGIFMDLVADKVLVAGVLIAMVAIELVPAWMAATIVIREFVVQSIRQLAAAQNTVISAAPMGKAKTLTTLAGLALLALGSEPTAAAEVLSAVRLAGFWTMVVATILTVVSGIAYLRDAWPLLVGRGPAAPDDG